MKSKVLFLFVLAGAILLVPQFIYAQQSPMFFDAFYERRLLEGIGHFVPREQPEAFVEAVQNLAAR